MTLNLPNNESDSRTYKKSNTIQRWVQESHTRLMFDDRKASLVSLLIQQQRRRVRQLIFFGINRVNLGYGALILRCVNLVVKTPTNLSVWNEKSLNRLLALNYFAFCMRFARSETPRDHHDKSDNIGRHIFPALEYVSTGVDYNFARNFVSNFARNFECHTRSPLFDFCLYTLLLNYNAQDSLHLFLLWFSFLSSYFTQEGS